MFDDLHWRILVFFQHVDQPNDQVIFSRNIRVGWLVLIVVLLLDSYNSNLMHPKTVLAMLLLGCLIALVGAQT